MTEQKPHRSSEVIFKDLADMRDRAAKVWEYLPDRAISANLTNETVRQLEQKLAAMEKGQHAIAVGTGQAAIVTVLLSCVKPGKKLLLPDNVYGPARLFADRQMKGWGIETIYYDPADLADIERKLSPETALVYLESPGTQTFEVQDISAIAKLAQARGILTAIDNTWSTPLFCNPIEHGIDIVIHSLSKLISGQGEIFGGAIIVKDRTLYTQFKDMQVFLGHWLSPDDAVMIMQNIETLPERLKQQQASAEKIAAFLKTQKHVTSVLAPFDADFSSHDLWKKYHTGAAGLFAFTLDAHFGEEKLAAFIDSLKLFRMGSGWGGGRSLVIPSKPARLFKQAPPNLIRIYIGREDPHDLINDLRQSFETLGH